MATNAKQPTAAFTRAAQKIVADYNAAVRNNAGGAFDGRGLINANQALRAQGQKKMDALLSAHGLKKDGRYGGNYLDLGPFSTHKVATGYNSTPGSIGTPAAPRDKTRGGLGDEIKNFAKTPLAPVAAALAGGIASGGLFGSPDALFGADNLAGFANAGRQAADVNDNRKADNNPLRDKVSDIIDSPVGASLPDIMSILRNRQDALPDIQKPTQGRWVPNGQEYDADLMPGERSTEVGTQVEKGNAPWIDAVIAAMMENGQVDTSKLPSPPAPVASQPRTAAGTPAAGAGQAPPTNPRYDPVMEAEYARRNPGFPNPYGRDIIDEDGNGRADNAQFDPYNRPSRLPTKYNDILGGIFGGGASGDGELGVGSGGGFGGFLGDIVAGAGTQPNGSPGWASDILESVEGERRVNDLRPDPYNMNIPGVGGVQFGNGDINFNPNATFDALTRGGYQGALDTLNDPQLNEMREWSERVGLNNMPGVFDKALNNRSYNPALADFNERTNALMGRGDELYQDVAGRDYMGDVGRERDALFASGTGQNQRGNRLLDGAENYQQVADERLGLMRDMSDPYEQRVRQQQAQGLFGSGNLGSKAGAMQQGELEMTLGNLDRQRVLDSLDSADRLRQFDIGAGTDLLRGGTDAISNAGNLFGMGADAQLKSGALGNDILNTQSRLTGQGLDGNLAGIGAENQRVRNRFSDLQQLFNFGQGTRAGQIDNAAALQNIGSNNTNTLLDMAGTAANPYGYNPQAGLANYYSGGGATGGSQQTIEDAIKSIFGI
jgi:hypothetical protein